MQYFTYRHVTLFELTSRLMDWLQELKNVKLKFQQSYLRNGIKNFEAQRPFLEELAALYEQKYVAENKWPDALKVRWSWIQQRLMQCHTQSIKSLLWMRTQTAKFGLFD